MTRRIYKVKDDNHAGERFVFHCPGCGHGHQVWTPKWSWNGSLEKPTFSPSVLVGYPPDFSEQRCHSFVTDGKIQFLSDCHHDLRGQTMELPDLDMTTEDAPVL